jgi:hypothetical protein
MAAAGQAMNQAVTLIVSAVVAALVSGGISYASQSRLLKRKAIVDYEFAAKTRLYEVIGPLRVQLLFAARDVVGRVRGHLAEQKWDMNPSEYYVRSFVYRLLRPFAVGQLIERQMSVMDFSVDPAPLELLHFDTAAQKMLSGDHIVQGAPTNWAAQTEHLYRDNLSAAAARLLVDTDDPVGKVMSFAQFQKEIPDLTADDSLRDLAAIFGACKGGLADNPAFWLRVVGYGYACNDLLSRRGADVGIAPVPYPVATLLGAVNEVTISSRAGEYSTVFDEIIAR